MATRRGDVLVGFWTFIELATGEITKGSALPVRSIISSTGKDMYSTFAGKVVNKTSYSYPSKLYSFEKAPLTFSCSLFIPSTFPSSPSQILCLTDSLTKYDPSTTSYKTRKPSLS